VRLTKEEALAVRVRSLLLLNPHPVDADGRRASVAEVVTWFGAMQAQDYASALWSLGLRVGSTRTAVEDALERREALRTWPMRGTVHLVPSRDAAWMLELMGSRALAGAAKRREHLGLSEQTAERAVEVLRSALRGGGRMSRAQCVATLEQAGVSGAGQLGYHVLRYVSQRGVTCIAPSIDGEQTFVLLDEWVPDPHRPDRDEALATMAVRYVRSHGPTTRREFAGWTGLTAADAKAAIAAAGDRLGTVDVEGTPMLVDAGVLGGDPLPSVDPARVLALPGFDEYLLGYKDRSLMLDAEHKHAIIPGGNGVFQPTLVRGGRVIGTWRRTTTRARTVVRVRPLVSVSRGDRRAVEEAFEPYARYLEGPVEVRWPDLGG
jgi:hypothetical protein